MRERGRWPGDWRRFPTSSGRPSARWASTWCAATSARPARSPSNSWGSRSRPGAPSCWSRPTSPWASRCTIAGESTTPARTWTTSVALYDPRRDAGHAFAYGQDPRVASLCYLAYGRALQGHEAEALRHLEAALRGAEERGPRVHARVRPPLRRPDPRAARATSGRPGSMPSARSRWRASIGSRFWLAGGTHMRGRVLAVEGRLEEGLSLMREGLAIWKATGAGLALPYYLSHLADAHLSAGDIAPGPRRRGRGPGHRGAPRRAQLRGRAPSPPGGAARRGPGDESRGGGRLRAGRVAGAPAALAGARAPGGGARSPTTSASAAGRRRPSGCSRSWTGPRLPCPDSSPVSRVS